MATEKPRYSITVPEDLFEKIEDFRFNRRYQSRSEATIELIKLGIKALEKQTLVKDNEHSFEAEGF